ncbi:hypothetical protein OAI84_00245 [bacterium]|nr:hypothetical protein [bacterium]
MVKQIFVAELEVSLGKVDLKSKLEHNFNIRTKTLSNIHLFKKIFYARGNNSFAFAKAPDIDESNFAKLDAWGHTIDDVEYNFFRLGGRMEAVFKNPYFIGHDENTTFWAEKEIVPNMELDMCVKKENWTFTSRTKIQDQLVELAWSKLQNDGNCIKVMNAQSWDSIREKTDQETNFDLVIELVIRNDAVEIKDNRLKVLFNVGGSGPTPTPPPTLLLFLRFLKDHLF